MKRVEIYVEDDKKVTRKTIESPWLRQEEAALYCGISRTAFRSRAARLPHAGDESLRLYHTNVLDAFVENRIPEAPFGTEAVPPQQVKRPRSSAAQGIIDPVTGRFFPAGGGKS